MKQNLQRIATREDLKAFATKNDVEGAKEYTRLLISATRGEIRQLRTDVVGLKTAWPVSKRT